VIEFKLVDEARDLDRSDAELLGRLQTGDSGAAALLYDRHHRGLYAYALSLLRDPGLSEDVVHETFLRLLATRPERPVVLGKSFVYAVARNLALDLLRGAGRQDAHRLPLARAAQMRVAPAAPEAGDEERRNETLLSALARLPQEQQETVTLKVFSGLTFAQIAEVLSVSAGTAASRYRYALEKLADMLQEGESR
jgi:RNA polymerase sigma-70 factor (ECF subfamily)